MEKEYSLTGMENSYKAHSKTIYSKNEQLFIIQSYSLYLLQSYLLLHSGMLRSNDLVHSERDEHELDESD